MSFSKDLEFNTRTDLCISPDDAHAVGTVTGTPHSRQGMGDLTVHASVIEAGSGVAEVQVLHADRKADGSAPDPGDYVQATDRDGADIKFSVDTNNTATIVKHRVVGQRLKEYYRVDAVVTVEAIGLGVEGINEVPQYDSLSDRDNVTVWK